MALFVDSSGNPSKKATSSLIQNLGEVKELGQPLPTGFFRIGYPATGILPGELSAGSLTYSMIMSWNPNPNFNIQVLFRATAPEIYMGNYVNDSFIPWKKVAFVTG